MMTFTFKIQHNLFFLINNLFGVGSLMCECCLIRKVCLSLYILLDIYIYILLEFKNTSYIGVAC